ncbi:YEATS domain-containing protein 2 [Drosophila biarmipes]|uniref:YEATS domain-containing protein 2 n=1 Tax=Drosophila biarmipes TaxID=125945 RepID=UPI0007E72A80|nr:YEATS domain-containing protein 2 [Drosophila biarmipes]
MDQPQTTPPKKRRHSEYHDPDYHQTDVPSQERDGAHPEDDSSLQGKRPKVEPAATTDEPPPADKLQRIRELLRVEFQREISQKVEQLAEIDRRLLQGRLLLDRLRYQVVNEYYRKQQVPLTAADVAKVRGDSLFGDDVSAPQLPLHPAIKKIVGKRPVPIQNHLPERTAATLAKETIRLRNPAHRRAERRRQQRIKEQGIVTDHSKDPKAEQEALIPVKLEQDEQPCTSRQAYERQVELNASRLNNKNKFLFVVGNTSKYIGVGSQDKATGEQALIYKWLVYVQGKGLPQPVGTYIKKVRFHLHHSYRPNDIVDVHRPPFQLNRRGWGEFPMRIQLFFQDHLQQKPVQLMHKLVLDKTMCGLHTMGAETTMEIWLRAEQALTKRKSVEAVPSPTPNLPPKAPDPVVLEPPSFAIPTESCKPRTISITQNKEELDDNLFAGINKIELSHDIEHIEPTVLVSEPLKLSYSPRKPPPTPPTPPKPQLRLNAAPVSASRPSVVYLPVNGRSPRQESTPERRRLEFSPEKQKPEPLPQKASPDRSPVKPLRNGQNQGQKNVVFQRAGKLYIIDPLQRKLKQAAKQQSLLKPQLSLLKPPSLTRWHMLQCMQHDHGYANMSADVEERPMLSYIAPSVIETSLQARPRRLEQIFGSAHFRNMRSAVEFLLRRLPLTAIDEKKEYPFTCTSLEEFHKLTALKQRCFEYLRARLLRRCLMQHHKLQQLDISGKEHYWSLREIVAFARMHGYTPPLKVVLTSVDKRRKPKLVAEEQLAQRVQAQLKGEPQPQLSAYSSLSPGNRLSAWIAKQTERLLGHDQRMRDKEFIDVLGVDKPHLQASRGNRLTRRSLTVVSNRPLLYLPPPKQLDTALQLVQEMCKDINITLEPEESPPGVSQPVALAVLSQVLRTFVERLVRRSLAAKLQQETMDHLPLTVANAPLCLQPQDIGRVIRQCADLDFLGNTHLGVSPMEPQT